MKKLITISLSFAFIFVVAACNKNNSKANRLNKNNLGGSPTDPQKTKEQLEKEKAEKEKAEKEKAELEAKKKQEAEEKKRAEQSQAGDGKSETTTDKSKTDSARDDKNSGSAGSTASTAVPDSKFESKSSVVQAGSDVKVTESHSRNYTQVDLGTETARNHSKIPALLNVSDDAERNLLVYCYDATVNFDKNRIKENLPMLSLFPKSEALIEVKRNVGNPNNNSDQNVSVIAPAYVNTSCAGDDIYTEKSSYYESNTQYDIIKLRKGNYHEDFLRSDNQDRELIQFSVACDEYANISSNLDRKKDDNEVKITNRVSLSPRSRLLFSRPVNYELKESGKQITLKESKKLKDYVVIECD